MNFSGKDAYAQLLTLSLRLFGYTTILYTSIYIFLVGYTQITQSARAIDYPVWTLWLLIPSLWVGIRLSRLKHHKTRQWSFDTGSSDN